MHACMYVCAHVCVCAMYVCSISMYYLCTNISFVSQCFRFLVQKSSIWHQIRLTYSAEQTCKNKIHMTNLEHMLPFRYSIQPMYVMPHTHIHTFSFYLFPLKHTICPSKLPSFFILMYGNHSDLVRQYWDLGCICMYVYMYVYDTYGLFKLTQKDTLRHKVQKPRGCTQNQVCMCM
jgi:hypothetical protein